MRSRYENLVGKKFGRLLVIKYTNKRSKNIGVIWKCKCDCGNITFVIANNLKSGNTKSCGCLKYKHGDNCCKNRARLYRTWLDMKTRCYNNKATSFLYYGAKGIQVCDEWKNNYLAFKQWALANGYKDNLTIDRIDSTGNYEPNNCRWITASENSRRIKKGKK